MSFMFPLFSREGLLLWGPGSCFQVRIKKKSILASMVPMSIMEFLLREPAMTSKDADSYDTLERSLIDFLGRLDQQTKKSIGNTKAKPSTMKKKLLSSSRVGGWGTMF